MSVAEATPCNDHGKPFGADLSEDGKGTSAPIPELKAGARYIYYRLYSKDGPLESNNPIYLNDHYISRISSNLVRPPHTAASLKKYLCKIEGLGTFEDCSLYQSLSERTALENSTRLSFRGTPGPGLSDRDPMALVVDASTAEKRSQTTSTVDPRNLFERDYEPHYVHYLIYDEDGGVVSKASFDENTTSLGRVNTLSIPPPHTVSSLKFRLIKSEEISGHNVQLFEDNDNESPMDDSVPISFLSDTFPGFLEERPLAIAYESQGLGIINGEDSNEILARDPQKARFALEELQKSKEIQARELAKVREELKGAKDTHARELAEKREELGKSKDTHAREIAEVRGELKMAKDTHARELAKVREELNRANDTEVREPAEEREGLRDAEDPHVRELAGVREELKRAQDKHARKLIEKWKELGEQEKLAIEAVLRQGGSPAQIKAVSERPSFTKKLEALEYNCSFNGSPRWHLIKVGDIFFTDGIFKKEKMGTGGVTETWEYGCYLGISPAGKVAFIFSESVEFC